MRELRVSRSSSDCMEGSGARQASDVKPKLKSYITKSSTNDVRVRGVANDETARSTAVNGNGDRPLGVRATNWSCRASYK